MAAPPRIRSRGRGLSGAAGVALGRMFPRGSKLDTVENRWRRLVDLPRERRCSFRCATDSICAAVAAVYRLPPSRRSQSPLVNMPLSAEDAPARANGRAAACSRAGDCERRDPRRL